MIPGVGELVLLILAAVLWAWAHVRGRRVRELEADNDYLENLEEVQRRRLAYVEGLRERAQTASSLRGKQVEELEEELEGWRAEAKHYRELWEDRPHRWCGCLRCFGSRLLEELTGRGEPD